MTWQTVAQAPKMLNGLGHTPVLFGGVWYARVGADVMAYRERGMNYGAGVDGTSTWLPPQGRFQTLRQGDVYESVAGVGDVPSVQQDIRSWLIANLDIADSRFNSGHYDGAVDAYQYVGNVAVSNYQGSPNIAGEIDALGAAVGVDTTAMTQKAWQMNTSLHNGDTNSATVINSTASNGIAADQTSAQRASDLAHQIAMTLQQALDTVSVAQANANPGGGSGTRLAQFSDATQQAAQALSDSIAQNGVPPESQVNETVRSFQQAYIADGYTLHGGADGRYGPATQTALSAVLQAPAPAPSGGGGGGGTMPLPAPSPAPAPAPGPVASSRAGLSKGQKWAIAIAAAAGTAVVGRAWWAKEHHEPFIPALTE